MPTLHQPSGLISGATPVLAGDGAAVAYSANGVITLVAANLGYDPTNGLGVLGAALFGRSNANDAADKAFRVHGGHYLVAEEPVLGVLVSVNVTENKLSYGGGSSLNNAATSHAWYDAANNVTTTGTLRGSLAGGVWALGLNSGSVGIRTQSPTAPLDVNADTIRLRTAKTPASASAAGNTGDLAWDADYVYVCVATNTWKRAPIATW
ncbi:MAG: hypothetical protein KIS66_05700 [Fimbriimonadaceae bacterium]|nr:hypothetical protein [Fimbriimonadaceae bacterium]